MGVGCETRALSNLAEHRPEVVSSEGYGGAASGAQEMLVGGLTREVVDGGALTDMAVFHHVGVFEDLERAIDGGSVEIRTELLDGGVVNRLSRQMFAV